jgi:hypothetical protein
MLAPAAAVQAQDEFQPADSAVLQSDAAALKEDLTLIAEAKGWTYEEALAQYEAAEAVGHLAEQIAAEHPEAFVGSALSDIPGGAPTLYIKGTADAFIRDLAGSAEVKVIIADGQPYSAAELDERSDQLHGALVEMGYDNIFSATDITTGTITAEIETTSATTADIARVPDELPQGLTAGVELNFVDRLDNQLEHGYGGARVGGGNARCTSGWTVVHINSGRSGVTTAGHCDGMTWIYEDGEGTWNLDYQAQHRGNYGDVEWHTVSGHTTPAKFYASPSTLRNTRSIEPGNSISLGESICVFGRSTGTRDCTAEVEHIGVSCTINGQTTRRLVRMNAHVTTGGDSGGGWSNGTRAYGSHVGVCSRGSVFTAAALFNSALGVQVKTQ